MRSSRIALSASVLLFSCLQACAATSDTAAKDDDQGAYDKHVDVKFNPASVNVDQKFADDVEVKTDSLVIPTSGHEGALSKIVVGSILAGNRTTTAADLVTSKNPYGFLRKVTDIKVEGGNTVLVTDRAELSDWIDEGDIIYSDPTSLLGAKTATTLGDKALHILGNDVGGGSGSAETSLNQTLEGEETDSADHKVKVRPKISFSNASFKMNANYDGYFKIRKFWHIPHEVEFKSVLTLDPVIAADITAGVTASLPLWEKEWSGPSVVIPIAAPIPITVRFEPKLKCSLETGGEITATAHAQINAHAAIGLEGSAGFNSNEINDISKAPTLSPSISFVGAQGKATIAVHCAIVAEPMVLAFDAVGLQGQIGPSIELKGTACLNYSHGPGVLDGGFTLAEQHGLDLEFGARVQIPFLGLGKDFPFKAVTVAKSEEKFLVGKKETCELKTVDSCEGRKDGFFCSEVNKFSGIIREGGQIASGLQCSTEQTCTGGTPTTINCK